jgi:hypothetical protein
MCHADLSPVESPNGNDSTADEPDSNPSTPSIEPVSEPTEQPTVELTAIPSPNETVQRHSSCARQPVN